MQPNKGHWTRTATAGSLDWSALRGAIDVPSALTRLLGPAPGRRGGRGRLWWRCPLGTHEDRNPSFTLQQGSTYWKCYGCGESGDLIDLVRRLYPSMTFGEAVAFVVGGPGRRSEFRKPQGAMNSDQPSEPTGLAASDALPLVTTAAEALWSPAGAEALAYLHDRGLRDETIRAHRLGWTPGVTIPRASGDGGYVVRGITIPWRVGDALALVKVRRMDGRPPKYVEAFRDPARLVAYPDAAAVRPDLPLVIVEGEFDALLLAQELAGLAVVVTLGSASSRPTARALEPMLASPVWYVATDADSAGDKAADAWPARAQRVRPPTLRPHPSDPAAGNPKSDWTDLYRHGVNLARWWRELLAGNPNPPLFTWDELAAMRWGPAAESQEGHCNGRN